MQHIILYTPVHICSPSYTDEELRTFQSILKQSVVDLIIVMIMLKRLSAVYS